jgi:rRNA-processing protein FCF1
MALIICDTDFLIKLANDPLPKFDRDVLVANDFGVLGSVYRELHGLEKSSSPKVAKRAKRAIEFARDTKWIKRLDLQTHPPTVEADEELIGFVLEDPKSRVLATLDGKLLSRCESLGLSYLTLKNNRALFRIKHRKGQDI